MEFTSPSSPPKVSGKQSLIFTNPNTLDITISELSLPLYHQSERVGKVYYPKPIVMTNKATSLYELTVKIQFAWNNIGDLFRQCATKHTIPFDIKGPIDVSFGMISWTQNINYAVEAECQITPSSFMPKV